MSACVPVRNTRPRATVYLSSRLNLARSAGAFIERVHYRASTGSRLDAWLHDHAIPEGSGPNESARKSMKARVFAGRWRR